MERLRAVLTEVPSDRAGAERAARASGLLAEFYGLCERADELLQEPEPPSDTHGSDVKGLTLHEAAKRVLEDAGTPLGLHELSRRIRARGWQHPRSTRALPEQLYHQLSAQLPKKTDTFERVSRGTFGLRGWNDPNVERPKPRLGVFSAPGQLSAREISEREDELYEPPPWRSS
ncbi:MAG: winged helix-turn-helix domain-containing protein [Actinomycetota bacterium]